MARFQTFQCLSRERDIWAAPRSCAGPPDDVDHTVKRILQEEEARGEEIYDVTAWGVKEDLYGFVAVALIRDSYLLATSRGNSALRRFRLVWCLVLLAVKLAIQCFLLYSIKIFVVGSAVKHAQTVYSNYEQVVYRGNVENIPGLGARGKPGLEPEWAAFSAMPAEGKKEICQFALSQPPFCFVILFIWALTCVGELQSCFARCIKYWRVPSVSTMREAIKRSTDGEGTANVRYVVGLTPCLRGAVLCCTCVPQATISCVLLWLGSRWLVATNSFENLVLNAAALEFIFMLKELFFRTMVSDRSKMDMANTLIVPAETREVASANSYLQGVLWYAVSLLWVGLYMVKLQQAIPKYQWDVNHVCRKWIAEEFLL